MRILHIEPFLAGSHAGFCRTLERGLDAEWTTISLPGRHWKWRMRGSSAYFALSETRALQQPHDLVLASSYLPLAELVGLVPALASIPRVLYFHENQLAYPVRPEHASERDHHFGFTQLVSALAASRCVFNSRYNLDSFVDAGAQLLGRMPDAVPPDWIDRVRERSSVLPVPLDLPDEPPFDDEAPGTGRAAGPVILWNHRWEHDKNAGSFVAALRSLHERNVPFRVAVCGERYREAPAELDRTPAWLGDRVLHWGFAPTRAEYERLLGQAHIVVSTSVQEFFGVAVLEAVHFGARPLVPNRLVYRELYPEAFRYEDDAGLIAALEQACRAWTGGDLELRKDRRELTRPFLAGSVLPAYTALFEALIRGV